MHLVKDDEQIVQLTVQVTADCDLLGDGGGREVQVGQQFQVRCGLLQNSGYVLGVQSMCLQQHNTYLWLYLLDAVKSLRKLMI